MKDTDLRFLSIYFINGLYNPVMVLNKSREGMGPQRACFIPPMVSQVIDYKIKIFGK